MGRDERPYIHIAEGGERWQKPRADPGSSVRCQPIIRSEHSPPTRLRIPRKAPLPGNDCGKLTYRSARQGAIRFIGRVYFPCHHVITVMIIVDFFFSINLSIVRVVGQVLGFPSRSPCAHPADRFDRWPHPYCYARPDRYRSRYRYPHAGGRRVKSKKSIADRRGRTRARRAQYKGHYRTDGFDFYAEAHHRRPARRHAENNVNAVNVRKSTADGPGTFGGDFFLGVPRNVSTTILDVRGPIGFFFEESALF